MSYLQRLCLATHIMEIIIAGYPAAANLFCCFASISHLSYQTLMDEVTVFRKCLRWYPLLSFSFSKLQVPDVIHDLHLLRWFA
jgi:hypothetical protein